MANISIARTGICSKLRTHHGQERFHLGFPRVDRQGCENIKGLTHDSSIALLTSPSSSWTKDRPFKLPSATPSDDQTRLHASGAWTESPLRRLTLSLNATKESSPTTRPKQHPGLDPCMPPPTTESPERNMVYENTLQPSSSLPATTPSFVDSGMPPVTESQDGTSVSEPISDALAMRSKDPLSSLLMEKNDSKLLVQMTRAPSKETTLSGEDRSSQDSLQGAEGSYQCSVCFKVFDTLFDLTLHQMWPTENKTLSCKDCREAFHSCWNFVSHQLEHLSGALCRDLKPESPSRDAEDVKPRGSKEDDSSTACNRLPTEKAPSNNAENASSKTKYPCGTCGKTFSGRPKLLLHLLSHKGRNVQSCSVCAKSFVSRHRLSQHMLTHSGQSLYSCGVCSRVFTQKSNLNLHALIHSEYRPYACTVCGKSFPHKQFLRTHMMKHATVRPYSCSVCAKSFIEKSHLELHKKTHSKPTSSHSCGVCNKSFAYNYQLLRHSLTHTEERSYSCDVCSKSFTQKYYLKNHMQTHSQQKSFSCTMCDKSFTRSRYLSTHILTHTGEKSYVCSVCNKAFARRSYLTRHVLTHTGQKNHSCTICLKTYMQRSSLTQHMLTHTRQKSYSCSICSESFAQKYSLTVHKLGHIGLKPYSCTLCSKSFRLKSYLSLHMRIHSGQRDFTCKVCSKSFTRPSIMQNHMQMHTDLRKYACTLCPKAFRQKETLSKHMWTHVG